LQLDESPTIQVSLVVDHCFVQRMKILLEGMRIETLPVVAIRIFRAASWGNITVA
jgi:hypothetical protein